MHAVLCLLVSSLFITSTFAARSLEPTTTAIGFDLTTTDTTLYPITITQTTGSTAYAYLTASGTVGQVSATTTTAVTPAPSGTSNAWTVNFKSNAGIPVTTVFTLAGQAATGTAAIAGVVITMPVGPQVSLSVVGVNTATSGTNTNTAGSLQTSASAVSGASTTCGSYYIDCAAGTLTFQANVPAVLTSFCTVTITQVPAVFGGLAYATALPTGALANLATAITSNSNGSGAPNYCGTLTNSGNTVYLFTQPLATSAATSDVTTAQAKLLAAIKAKTAFTGSARLLEESERVLATSYTLVNGYATALPTNNAGGVVAPSTTASASLAANATSQSRVVIFAGLFTTILAAVFGLAL